MESKDQENKLHLWITSDLQCLLNLEQIRHNLEILKDLQSFLN